MTDYDRYMEAFPPSAHELHGRCWTLQFALNRALDDNAALERRVRELASAIARLIEGGAR